MKNLLAQVNIGDKWILRPGQNITSAKQFETPGNLISILLKDAYVAAGVILFVLLLFGGISIILGAGGNDPKKAAQGQKTIVAALSGFLLIFASYWIIQLVQTLTGVEILNPGF